MSYYYVTCHYFIEYVIWNNDAEFEILNDNRWHYIWSKMAEAFKKGNIKLTMKYKGESIMIYECFGAWKLTNLIILNDRLKTIKYIDMLKENLFHSIGKYGFSK